MSDLSDAIETAAGKAAKAKKGDAEITQRPLGELIEADRHLGQVTGGEQANLGLRFRAQKPPGAWA